MLTNYHVIEDGDNVTVTFTNGDVVETEIVGHDEYADIAVLSVDSSYVTTVAQIGSSEEARVGDTVTFTTAFKREESTKVGPSLLL